MIAFRELTIDDYDKGYMSLLYQLTSYDYPMNKNKFGQYISDMKNKCKILVVYMVDNGNEILVGAGTIFKLAKLHNNAVGQIEDVVIDEKYRGSGLGKLLINELIKIGLDEFGCYKVVLNSLDKNVGFYVSCGFQKVGNEFKYVPLIN